MSLKYEAYPDEDTFEITVSGKITEADYDAVSGPITEFASTRSKFRFIEIVEDFEGVEPSILWDGLKLDMKLIPKISHCAVVSDLGWVESLMEPAQKMMSAKLKYFPMSEIDEARAWVRTAD